MQLWAQWWLVITRPSGETNEPEQPPASRTEESCASVSHFASGLNPYFFATFALGKLSNVHMPSSACAASNKAANGFMWAPRRDGGTSLRRARACACKTSRCQGFLRTGSSAHFLAQ